MKQYPRCGPVAATGLLLLSLTGCSPGAASTPGDATAAVAATSASTTAVPSRLASPATPAPVTATASIPVAPTASSATPVVAGPAAVISGTEVCGSFDGGTTTTAGGTEQLRGAVATCTATMNDPRVSGTDVVTFNYDGWTAPGGAQSIAMQWGAGRLTTPGGTWEGDWAGVIYPGLRDDITLWYRGTGAYAGLTYTAHLTGSMGRYVYEGLIYPGTPPTWP